MSSESDSDDGYVRESKEKIIRRLQEKGTGLVEKSVPPPKRRPWIPPQNAVDKAWARFSVKIFSHATAVLPVSFSDPDQQQASPPEQGELVAKIFKDAAEACTQKVEKIVKEHQRVNQRYRDPHFDIDLDLKSRRGHCLGNLAEPTQWSVKLKSGKSHPNDNLPKSVKRIDVSDGLTNDG